MPTANRTTAVATRDDKPPAAIALIREDLELRIDDIKKVLPKGMDVERFTRVALLAIAKNNDLLQCTRSSLVTAIVEAAEIGLEPTGSLNRAWLVPFRENQQSPKEAQLIIGYQGYADLMRDGDARRRVVAEVVYEGDHFKVVKGSEVPRIEHEPAYLTDDPTKITHAYAIIFYPDGTNQFEVMTKGQIDIARSGSKQRNGKAWTEGYAQMGRKTALRRLSNYTPLTARVVEAIARDDEREYGDAPATATTTRTAEVRSAIQGRIAAKSAGPEVTATTDPDVAPEASATQQGDAASDETTTDAVCGATSDPKLGAVESCALSAGHANADDTPSAHESAAGTKFPNRGVA